MGHSMGGGATMLAAENNNSIAGIVGLAPAETNPTAIGVCGNISVPALIFSGASDGVAPPASNHLPMYQGLQSSCKSYVSITGGAHCYFAISNFNCDFGESTSSQGISITRAEQQQKTFAILDPWLAYVLGEDCFALTEFHQSLNQTSGTVNQTSCPVTGINANIFYDNANTLWTSTPGTAYQWSVNGQTMQGETNDTLIIPMDFGGNFSVSVFSPNGCDTSSFITIQGSIQVNNLDYQVTYNAQTHSIQVILSTPYSGTVSLFDLQGRSVEYQIIESNSIDIPCKSLSKGLYLIRVGNNPSKRILID